MLRMMTNKHTLLSSLYENPLAAGTIPADVQAETACHDRLVGYLLRNDSNDRAAIDLAPVVSMPTLPPRAHIAFAPVVSMPVIPPRAHFEFAPVVSMPVIPPRAHIEFAPVASMPTLPPRA
jgi:hypothetical protein